MKGLRILLSSSKDEAARATPREKMYINLRRSMLCNVPCLCGQTQRASCKPQRSRMFVVMNLISLQPVCMTPPERKKKGTKTILVASNVLAT